MRIFIALLKFSGFVLCCAAVLPTQGLVLLCTKGPAAHYLPQLWCRLICAIFGIKFEIEGTPETGKQTLYMGNHLSYMDIPVIGSILRASFVAKSEVETWPLFGTLAKLQQTAFIRRKRSAIRKEKNVLQRRVESGESLIIFPEGTSTDGLQVLPFKSSLFALALGEGAKDIHIQPMTLQILAVDGKSPDDPDVRDLYAWHIDMDTPMAEHLWRFAKTTGARLKLTFHPPIKAGEFENRKILARICHEKVSKGLDIDSAAE